jgi:RHS repeat-associated protein
VQVFTYDPVGNVTAVTRGQGGLALDGSATLAAGQSTTRYQLYDSLGRRTHTVDPDGGTYLYFYNQLGDLVRTIDARGVQNRYVYDLGGRLVAEDHQSDGALWAATDATTAANSDDRASRLRLGFLTAQLFDYEHDTDNDFRPEQGADVLYGHDQPYDGAADLCRASPELKQTNLAGRVSWVRDPSGCSWSRYDERGRSTWSARQVDPGEQVFVSLVSYAGPKGPDDLNRVRSETFPDGTSAHYSFSQRGLLESVTGQAPEASSLFCGRTFADDIRHDEFGLRTSWLLGDSSGNQVRTTYEYDARRRLELMTSQLSGADGTDQVLARTEYHYDPIGNIVRLEDQRTFAETADWAPEPVTYDYQYDALYRLTRASPTYPSTPSLGMASIDNPALQGIPARNGRAGIQEWTHDGLGSMRSWTAVEPVAGEHFYKWSLGDIINGQQLLEAGAVTGVSSRCALVPEATARVSGPAPHALYFAYQATATDSEFNGLEACYDASGNMVALYRLELSDCGAEPLVSATADWTCANQNVMWELQLTWDAVGRLARVEKIGAEAATDIRHVYDATDRRVLRLDHESTEGNERATLYISQGYEIRDAALDVDGSYYGGEETKHIFVGEERIARVVERLADGVSEWPNAPGGAYVFHTLTNHVGSASVTFNAHSLPDQDAIVVAQTQLPYGTEDARVVSSDYGGWGPDYEFTGKEEDPDVGLMYFGARFYAPGTGRWINVDPLGFHTGSADPNSFRYVYCRPTSLIDPAGLDGEEANQSDPPSSGAPTCVVALVRWGVDNTVGLVVRGTAAFYRSFTEEPPDMVYDMARGAEELVSALQPAYAEGERARGETYETVYDVGSFVVGLAAAGRYLLKKVAGRAGREVTEEATEEALERSVIDLVERNGDEAVAGYSLLDEADDTVRMVDDDFFEATAGPGGTAPVRPLGRGTTVNGVDRWHPRDLREQMAVETAMQNPSAGVRAAGPLGDSRWHASEGWVKMQQTVNPGGRGGPISVHYNYNTTTGAVDDFKIVARRPHVPPPDPRVSSGDKPW